MPLTGFGNPELLCLCRNMGIAETFSQSVSKWGEVKLQTHMIAWSNTSQHLRSI